MSYIYVQSATAGHLKLIGDKIRQCPACSGTDIDSLALKVMKEKHFVSVMVIQLLFLLYFLKKHKHSFEYFNPIFQPTIACRAMMQKYSSGRKNCTLTMAQEEMMWMPMFFALPKSSPYKEEINRA